MARRRKWRPSIPRAPATPNGVFSYKSKRGGTGVHKGLRTQIEGIEIFDANFNRIMDSLAFEDLSEAVEDASEVFEELLVELAPVDRGGFRASMAREEVKEDTVFVGKSGSEWDTGHKGGAFRGLFLELGTIFMAAQPFMRPAFDAGKPTAIDAFKKRVLRVMRLRRAA